MITYEDVKKLVFTFPEVVEEGHFDKLAFKVRKKIFATYDAKKNAVTIKLSLADQDLYVVSSKKTIYPVPNKWGAQGWTIIELANVHPDLFADALATAYDTVAPKALERK